MVKNDPVIAAMEKRRKRNLLTAARLKALRIANRFKASWVADQMGITAAYLCYLEQGKREWTDALESKFLKAIGEL